MTAPEIALPELDGKTAEICMTDHFKPLWSKNAPRFGNNAHAMALDLGP